MSVVRFLYNIIVILLLIFLGIAYKIELFEVDIFVIVGPLLVLIYFIILRKEKINNFKASKLYFQDCDPEAFIEEFIKLSTKRLYSKNTKIRNKINLIHVYLSNGDLKSARIYLESLVEDEPKYSPVIKFSYYLAWSYYFEQKGEIEQLKTLIGQLEQLIIASQPKHKRFQAMHLKIITTRLYILENIHLDIAEKDILEILNNPLLKINIVVNVYYLGVIAYKQKRFDQATEYFDSVVLNGNKLIQVKKANLYLNKIKEVTQD